MVNTDKTLIETILDYERQQRLDFSNSEAANNVVEDVIVLERLSVLLEFKEEIRTLNSNMNIFLIDTIIQSKYSPGIEEDHDVFLTASDILNSVNGNGNFKISDIQAALAKLGFDRVRPMYEKYFGYYIKNVKQNHNAKRKDFKALAEYLISTYFKPVEDHYHNENMNIDELSAKFEIATIIDELDSLL